MEHSVAMLGLFFALAYIVGSINFSILATKIQGKGDVRNYGSGNAGTINTYRILGKGWALAVLSLDVSRAALVYLLAQHFFHGEFEPLLASSGVLIGNLFPIFHKFKGGKGIATTIGLFLSIEPTVGLVGLFVWLMVVLITRISSLGSIIMCISYPFTLLIMNRDQYTICFSVVILLIIQYTHRQNIKRLLRRQEPKLSRIK